MGESAGWVVVDEEGNESDELSCAHLGLIGSWPDAPRACEDCLREGTDWVHLRQCLVCGGVRCCNDSPRRHSSGHWQAAGHPLMRSTEPGEDWGWCYADEVPLLPGEA